MAWAGYAAATTFRVSGHDGSVPGGGAQEQQPPDRRTRDALVRFVVGRERIGLGSCPAHLLLDAAQFRLRLAGYDGLVVSVEDQVDDSPDRTVDRHLRPAPPASMEDADQTSQHGRLMSITDERSGPWEEADVQRHPERRGQPCDDLRGGVMAATFDREQAGMADACCRGQPSGTQAGVRSSSLDLRRDRPAHLACLLRTEPLDARSGWPRPGHAPILAAVPLLHFATPTHAWSVS
jgi:hypothetical protein